MSIKVNYNKNIVKNKNTNYVLFCDKNFKILGLKKTPLSKDSLIINKTLESNKIEDKNFLTFNSSKIKKFIIFNRK